MSDQEQANLVSQNKIITNADIKEEDQKQTELGGTTVQNNLNQSVEGKSNVVSGITDQETVQHRAATDQNNINRGQVNVSKDETVVGTELAKVDGGAIATLQDSIQVSGLSGEIQNKTVDGTEVARNQNMDVLQESVNINQNTSQDENTVMVGGKQQRVGNLSYIQSSSKPLIQSQENAMLTESNQNLTQDLNSQAQNQLESVKETVENDGSQVNNRESQQFNMMNSIEPNNGMIQSQMVINNKSGLSLNHGDNDISDKLKQMQSQVKDPSSKEKISELIESVEKPILTEKELEQQFDQHDKKIDEHLQSLQQLQKQQPPSENADLVQYLMKRLDISEKALTEYEKVLGFERDQRKSLSKDMIIQNEGLKKLIEMEKKTISDKVTAFLNTTMNEAVNDKAVLRQQLDNLTVNHNKALSELKDTKENLEAQNKLVDSQQQIINQLEADNQNLTTEKEYLQKAAQDAQMAEKKALDDKNEAFSVIRNLDEGRRVLNKLFGPNGAMTNYQRASFLAQPVDDNTLKSLHKSSVALINTSTVAKPSAVVQHSDSFDRDFSDPLQTNVAQISSNPNLNVGNSGQAIQSSLNQISNSNKYFYQAGQPSNNNPSKQAIQDSSNNQYQQLLNQGNNGPFVNNNTSNSIEGDTAEDDFWYQTPGGDVNQGKTSIGAVASTGQTNQQQQFQKSNSNKFYTFLDTLNNQQQQQPAARGSRRQL